MLSPNTLLAIESSPSSGFAANRLGEIRYQYEDALCGIDPTLDRISIRRGNLFEYPAADGMNMCTAREITGIILLNQPANALFRESYHGESSSPVCCSYDGIRGSCGRTCSSCPRNHRNNRGNSVCKQRRMLYILVERSTFPMTMFLPSSSVYSLSRYIRHLFETGRDLDHVITSIHLVQAVSPDGAAYTQVIFSDMRMLTEEEYQAVSLAADWTRDFAKSLADRYHTVPAEDRCVSPEVPEWYMADWGQSYE